MAVETIVNRVFPDIKDSSSDLGKAYGLIEAAAQKQKALIKTGRFDSLQEREGPDLLNIFSADPNYHDLINLARFEVGNFEDDHMFKRGLAGALFERLALTQLSSRKDLGGVVISGESLLEIMTSLHQGVEQIEGGFGQVGIYGVYIPDGLLVGKVNGKLAVKGIVEVSLAAWSVKESRDSQMLGYKHLVESLGLNNESRPPFYIVTPEFEIKDNGYDGVKHHTVPVQRRDFLDILFDQAYFTDDRAADRITLNHARQIYRQTGEVIAIPASI